MVPNKRFQVARFHTPLPEENPNQLYLVMELATDVQIPRATIIPLNFDAFFPPALTIPLTDLETVKFETQNMMGAYVSVIKDDSSIIKGFVTRALDSELFLELDRTENGIISNCRLELTDHEGVVHEGYFVVTDGDALKKSITE